jgi:hypothetical protein
METKDWVDLQEKLLKAQINVLHDYQRSVEPEKLEKKASKINGTSNLDLIKDILAAANSPLHVSEIIQQANEQHGVSLDRESVVSALTKKIQKGVIFVRTGPNTFGLKGQ